MLQKEELLETFEKLLEDGLLGILRGLQEEEHSFFLFSFDKLSSVSIFTYVRE